MTALKTQKHEPKKLSKLKFYSLGGLDEIGKNMYVYEYEDSILVVDSGLAFPDDEMPGIDLVIPDISYLLKNREKVVGIIITHGHEDHIGALPYVLKELNVPVYGTNLTIGLIKCKLAEHGSLNQYKLNTVKAGNKLGLGNFLVEVIHSNHSIADSVMFAIHTPVGTVIHTGDFKIDCTPIDGTMIDLAKLGELGKKGVLALVSDSTNAERQGYTMSERSVGAKFDEIFSSATDRRIIVATFASNIHRVQQVINSAVKYGRKVAVSGRSMENILDVASELGYMKIPKGTIIKLDEVKKFPPNRVVVCTTGSQGEPMAGLSRMAMNDHKTIEITSNDLVVISASPIPGNEKMISKVVDELFKKGAEVIYNALDDIHVSGHAKAEELKIIIGITKPKFFIPVHGEHRHLMLHKHLAELMGVPPENGFIMGVGQVFETDGETAKINGSVPSGKVLIDGLGVGDVGNIVLRDRKHLAQDGLIVIIVSMDSVTGEVVSDPDIISRGFVYMRESEDLISEIRERTLDAIEDCRYESSQKDWGALKVAIRSHLNTYLYQKTKRSPMLLPVIVEV
ncbi:MAG: ribonuclease J [Ruminococcaceae bacterium]|nr:ribonuclease J [Oscillospiraceae bacterium]